MSEEAPTAPEVQEKKVEPGTLDDFIARLRSRFGDESVDELWIFPARRAGQGESTVIVISAFDTDRERRRVITARFAVTRDPKGNAVVEESLEEHAIAPADRVGRVIEGVLRRLGDELTSPSYFAVGGAAAGWPGQA